MDVLIIRKSHFLNIRDFHRIISLYKQRIGIWRRESVITYNRFSNMVLILVKQFQVSFWIRFNVSAISFFHRHQKKNLLHTIIIPQAVAISLKFLSPEKELHIIHQQFGGYLTSLHTARHLSEVLSIVLYGHINKPHSASNYLPLAQFQGEVSLNLFSSGIDMIADTYTKYV